MNITWAVEQMKKGDKVRLQDWSSVAFLYKDGNYYYGFSNSRYIFTAEEMESDRWELYEIRDIN